MEPFDKNFRDTGFDSPPLDEILFNSFWDSFGNLPIGIIVIDQKSVIRFFNAMAGFFLGIQPLSAIGKPVKEIDPESHMPETLVTGAAFYDKQRIINLKVASKTHPELREPVLMGDLKVVGC